MTKGRTIRLFLVDGTPTGILTAEIMNWTGHVSVAPRSRIADLIKREEVRRTGIYFLSGPDPENSSRLQVYIGESDDVGKRLAQHNKDETKDFWERACVVTSKDQNLTKGHVKYMESSLITIAQEEGWSKLNNKTKPDYGYLPESEISDMNFFIEQIRIILPTLGLNFLKAKPKIPDELRSIKTVDDLAKLDMKHVTIFELENKKRGVRARGTQGDDAFTVWEGSEAAMKWTADRKAKTYYWRLHDQLCESGVLLVNEENTTQRIFNEDTNFSSPSAAAAVINGRSSNGRKEWKMLGTNETYADWQTAQLDDIAQEEETGE